MAELHERIITRDSNGDTRDVLVRMVRLTSLHYYNYRVTVYDRELQQTIFERSYRARDTAFRMYESYTI